MTLRLLLADDHAIIRAGVRTLLANSNIEIVGEAETGKEAINQSVNCDWDVALIDVVMPDGSGFDVAERLRQSHPNLPVVLYTAFDNPRFAARASALGTAGFLLKAASRETMIEVLQAAVTGRTTRTRRMSTRYSGSSDEVPVHVEVSLTERERQVIEKLADGLTNKQIAQTLDISYETVKEHVQHILQKIGVTDRTQAAVWAVRKGLI